MPNESDKFDKILDELLKNPPSSNDGEEEASILFVNLYGADRLTEQMEVQTRVELFKDYFEVMVDTIFNHRGTLDKYIGSTIMAVFNSLVLTLLNSLVHLLIA